MYLDDGIVSAPQFEQAKVMSEIVKTSLAQAGFIVHPTKFSGLLPIMANGWVLKLILNMGLFQYPRKKLTRSY